MQALMSDGPLEGRTIGVDTKEGNPPKTIDVDVKDGSVYSYAFDRVDDERGVAVYTYRDSWAH
jgi:hypothetical protein